MTLQTSQSLQIFWERLSATSIRCLNIIKSHFETLLPAITTKAVFQKATRDSHHLWESSRNWSWSIQMLIGDKAFLNLGKCPWLWEDPSWPPHLLQERTQVTSRLEWRISFFASSYPLEILKLAASCPDSVRQIFLNKRQQFTRSMRRSNTFLSPLGAVDRAIRPYKPNVLSSVRESLCKHM